MACSCQNKKTNNMVLKPTVKRKPIDVRRTRKIIKRSSTTLHL